MNECERKPEGTAAVDAQEATHSIDTLLLGHAFSKVGLDKWAYDQENNYGSPAYMALVMPVYSVVCKEHFS